MKLFDVEIEFFEKTTEKSLYKRNYTIVAEDEEHAKAIIHNHLTLLDFYNFKITKVFEVSND